MFETCLVVSKESNIYIYIKKKKKTNEDSKKRESAAKCSIVLCQILRYVQTNLQLIVLENNQIVPWTNTKKTKQRFIAPYTDLV